MTAQRVLSELKARSADPLRIAVVGAGFLGRSLVRQCTRTPGLRVVALADRHLDRALRVLGTADEPAAACGTVAELRAAGARGERGACLDPMLLADLRLDALVDCSGDPELGMALALAAIERGCAFFANAEADATAGPALARRARAEGVLFSGCGGDEHAEALGLVRHAELLGVEVVAAGKFKGFLDRAATPASVAPWAERHAQSPYSLAAFADGTKMSVEMALLANATGLVPDVRGMHCARLERDAVARALSCEPGGMLVRPGVVEVVLAAEPTTSVFVVVRTEDPELQRELAYLKLGEGPAYLLTKPFHLCGIELAASIAAALLEGEPTIAARGAPVAAVFATAKRDLERGTVLERIGGTTHYGVIDAWSSVAAQDLLPMGLARGARLRRALSSGTPITFGDVEMEDDSPGLRLVAEATALLAPEPRSIRPPRSRHD